MRYTRRTDGRTGDGPTSGHRGGNLICWPPIYHVTRIFDDVTRGDVAPARRSRARAISRKATRGRYANQAINSQCSLAYWPARAGRDCLYSRPTVPTSNSPHDAGFYLLRIMADGGIKNRPVHGGHRAGGHLFTDVYSYSPQIVSMAGC